MSGIVTIIKKEWLNFLGSDKGIFFLYLFMILSWSVMLAFPSNDLAGGSTLWIVLLSVVVSANFSTTVFISERVNGTLEILITSGLSRKDILYGKLIFVWGMSFFVGAISLLISPLWDILFNENHKFSLTFDSFLLYGSAVYMNTASSALLSILMSNPRLLTLINLITMGVFATLYSILDIYLEIKTYGLSLVLIIIGIVATILAQKQYEGEKITKPVIF
ncbi:MAG: ABC transporter permease subunit [Chitinispirillaceae bacterium]|nr:ABC transporter permease subunit [Chitinispirillaceae bacterium]